MTDNDEDSSPLGKYGVETLPAGSRLQTWVQITNATSTQAAFLRDVLAVFAARGHLGGRIAAGHGRVIATTTATVLRGQLPTQEIDWAAELADRRDDAIKALAELT